jgi:hypothetical protein
LTGLFDGIYASGTPLRFNTLWRNTDNCFNTTTGYFTAPVTGNYFFAATTGPYPSNSPARFFLHVFDSQIHSGYAFIGNAEGLQTSTVHGVYHMYAEEKAWVESSGDKYFSGHGSAFTGFLVSAGPRYP